MNPENEPKPEDDRRAFLKKCGEFAVITPPAVAFLLSTSMSSKAIAGSSGRSRGGSGVFLAAGAGVAGVGVGVAATQQDAAPGHVVAPTGVAPPTLAPAPPIAPATTETWQSSGERG